MSMGRWTSQTARAGMMRQNAWGSEYGATYDAALDGLRGLAGTRGALGSGIRSIGLGSGIRSVGLGHASRTTYGANPWGAPPYGGLGAIGAGVTDFLTRFLESRGGAQHDANGSATINGERWEVSSQSASATGPWVVSLARNGVTVATSTATSAAAHIAALVAQTEGGVALGATGAAAALAAATVGTGILAAAGTALSGATSGALVGAVAGGRNQRMKYAGRGALAGATIASVAATLVGAVAWAGSSSIAAAGGAPAEAVRSGAMTFTLANAALAAAEITAMVLTGASK